MKQMKTMSVAVFDYNKVETHSLLGFEKHCLQKWINI